MNITENTRDSILKKHVTDMNQTATLKSNVTSGHTLNSSTRQSKQLYVAKYDQSDARNGLFQKDRDTGENNQTGVGQTATLDLLKQTQSQRTELVSAAYSAKMKEKFYQDNLNQNTSPVHDVKIQVTNMIAEDSPIKTGSYNYLNTGMTLPLQTMAEQTFVSNNGVYIQNQRDDNFTV